MSTEEVAHSLGVSSRTIIRWRCDRVNIPFNYIGGQARYEPEDVQSYKERTRVDVGLPCASRYADNAA
jgi:excisionase family DNA binding protein